MLLLVFQVKDDSYAIDSSKVVEVIPLVKLQSLPMSPDYVAGIFNYRGKSVPVIDLCEYFKNKKYNRYFSTRIIIIKHIYGEEHIVGLLAENVTDVLHQDESKLVDHGMNLESTPFLGKLVMDDNNVIQNILPENLISNDLSEILFKDTEAVK